MIDFGVRKKKYDLSIDITPLVDIILQLIIFFVLSTTFIQNYNGVNIVLPRSSLPRVDKQKKLVVVSIDRKGNYYLDGKLCKKDDIGSLLKKRLHRSGWIMIKADKNVPYKFVITLMDVLHKNALNRFWLATLPER